MTPQSSFMILAKIDLPREAELRTLLASMNRELGVVDPSNKVIPFNVFPQIHFARIVILDDATLDDISVYGLPRTNYPKYLALLGEIDGPEEAFLEDLVRKAGEGLRRLFSFCEDYSASVDLLSWIKSHDVKSGATYVNWIGRTMQQVREEEALRKSLQAFVQQNNASLRSMPPREIRDALKKYSDNEMRAGAIVLSPDQATPSSWQIGNFLNLIGVPLLVLILSPLLLLFLPFFLLYLRHLEKTDAVIAPRVDPAHANTLASIEDHDVTNQFSAMGTLKPGVFRRLTILAVLQVIDYTAKHIFNRGRLGRVTTIHFARWVFLDDGRRVIFVSNYDGSLESYMDDFINKVAFGLNVVFSNGVGYPRTNWLLFGGAKDEQHFKDFLRRHQMPTQVWYNAYPGLTALDRRRNTLIREGLQNDSMTEEETRAWLQLL
jgi:hypothetical protein